MKKQRKIVGVLGGLGPQATVYFCDRLVRLMHQSYARNSFTMPILDVYILPGLEFIERNVGLTQSRVYIEEAIAHFGRSTDIVVSPCNTLNAYLFENRPNLPFSFLDIINETAKFVRGSNIKKAYLLATQYTIRSQRYQRLLQPYGIDTVLPTEDMSKRLTRFIRDVTREGVTERNSKRFNRLLAAASQFHGIQGIILGCTELCLFPSPQGIRMVNSMDILASAVLREIERPPARHMSFWRKLTASLSRGTRE